MALEIGMKSALQTLKILRKGFSQAPFSSLAGIARSVLYRLTGRAQVARLREQTRATPLILQIETTNVCNAACLFCAYPGMKRNKGVMSLSLFDKIIKEYAEMGGRSVTLTPLVGDALLDPHLLERLDILERYPAVDQITLTTNGIALQRFSDAELCRLLSSLYCIQISIGGLDQATYEMMYGVDRFSQVHQAMQRLVHLAAGLPRPAQITFAFRTNDAQFEARFKDLLAKYRASGVFISHIWTYANYSGAVSGDEKRNLVVARNRERKQQTCVTPSMCMGICWDGSITACSCADFEGDKLQIGEAQRDALAEVWQGERRAEIMASFAKGKLRPICRGCSAYTPDTIFGYPCFNGVQPRQPLPLDFFHNMMT